MTPAILYLKDGVLPKDKKKARLQRLKAARYTLYDNQLYKRGFSTLLLKCVDLEQGNHILQEIHEGICGNHAEGQSLAYKAQAGYFWPTIDTEFYKEMLQCQRFPSIPRSHPEKLTSMTSPWPFAVWGIDLIGPMPTARPTFKYAVVVVDYFTKWAEAKLLVVIFSKKVQEFIWESIICRFGVHHEIVSDNRTQFNSNEFRNFCDHLGIKKNFSLVDHSQTNGQVKAVNKLSNST